MKFPSASPSNLEAFVHNFSPHKTFPFNNCNILIRNKSLFFPKWLQRDLNQILNLFGESGDILSYEQFMNVHSFPIPLHMNSSIENIVCVHRVYKTLFDWRDGSDWKHQQLKSVIQNLFLVNSVNTHHVFSAEFMCRDPGDTWSKVSCCVEPS